MYTLDGAFFLTKSLRDVGFPTFRVQSSNAKITCALDKNLKIVKFFPLYNTNYYFLPLSGDENQYGVGSFFKQLLIRRGKEVDIVVLDDFEKLVDVCLNVNIDSFIRLYVSRYLADQDKKYKKIAISVLSEASEHLIPEREARAAYLSSEISLLQHRNELWGNERVSKSVSITNDEIFEAFKGISKVDAVGLLGSPPSSTGGNWAYIYAIYKEKFGFDEFLYLVGKRFVGFVAMTSSRINSIEAEIIFSIVSQEASKIAGLLEYNYTPEFDLQEMLEDLLESSTFVQLCDLRPEFATHVFSIVFARTDPEQQLTSILEFVIDNFESINVRVRSELFRRASKLVRLLSSEDLIFFIEKIYTDEEVDQKNRVLSRGENYDSIARSVVYQLKKYFHPNEENSI